MLKRAWVQGLLKARDVAFGTDENMAIAPNNLLFRAPHRYTTFALLNRCERGGLIPTNCCLMYTATVYATSSKLDEGAFQRAPCCCGKPMRMCTWGI